MDSLSRERAERVERSGIATSLLPALGLGPYARPHSRANVASETASGQPEQAPQKDRQASEGVDWGQIRAMVEWLKRERPEVWVEWRRVRENSTADTPALRAAVAEWLASQPSPRTPPDSEDPSPGQAA